MRSLRILGLVSALMLVAAPVVTTPAAASVSVGISVGIAPPPLPVYDQPPIPGPGYVWVPGYWAWGPYGYYWVPGTWVLPPAIGLLWTPPWWSFVDGAYVFHVGYWGPVVGFYGGINYGFGYFGHGYDGGYWDHGRFFYNREVNNIRNVNITNVYSRPVSTVSTSRVSFNGGPNGIDARPNSAEQAALNRHHVGPTALQLRNLNAARSNRQLQASINHGSPPVTATRFAGRFGNTTSQRSPTPTAHNLAGGRPEGTSNATTPHQAPRTFGTTSPRGVQPSVGSPSLRQSAGPRVTPQRTVRSFSHPGPSRFGAGRNAIAPRTPTANFAHGGPARFGAGRNAAAPHPPMRTFAGGRPAAHAPRGPQRDQRRHQ